MFRGVRSSKQELTREETVEILSKCNYGTLACLGDEGYPYAVPMSFVYSDDKIYFHSAKTGHKLDAIQREPKVSFAVTSEEPVIGQEYTTYFRSAIAFGRARITEGEEWKKAVREIFGKYSGNMPSSEKVEEIAESTPYYVIAIDIEHVTGTESVELTTQGLTT